ncbi:MAG: STAS-like domain-containing protein [Syntrophobacterales bacterium]|jgi:hypothetical protein|nr:STAS-like domain-containing protein [Syntrophobacterales bacterium]
MIINLKDKCGKQTITREDGQIINDMIVHSWEREERIVIDFSNILIASVSFLDEAFGKLSFYFPKEILIKKLYFDNIQDYDRALLNDIFISRYHQKELGENGFSKPKKRKLRRSALKR